MNVITSIEVYIGVGLRLVLGPRGLGLGLVLVFMIRVNFVDSHATRRSECVLCERERGEGARERERWRINRRP